MAKESSDLKLLKTDIHQTPQAIARMQRELAAKQKRADEIERSIDEKTSLLKVSEFIQSEKDKTELMVLIEEIPLGEFDNCCLCSKCSMVRFVGVHTPMRKISLVEYMS